MNLSAKGCKKWLNSWKSTKNDRFGQTLATFRTNYHVFAFRSTFQEKVAKSASFREKARKIIDLAKTLEPFEQTTMSLHFDEHFREKLQKVPHFVKKHKKPSIWLKLWHFFEQTTMFWFFNEPFSKRLREVAHLVKKHEKWSVWLKLCNFSNKLAFLCISINFSGKRCKKCLISWKSAKNRRFGQNFGCFRTNYHVLVFRWTFQQKVARSGSIREKARKIIDLAKTLQLFEQTTMSLHFDELFRKKLQKVPHFVKKHENSSIWQKLYIFL